MISYQPPYPVCPICGGKIAGFAKPNKPFKNDPSDYDQKSAELYCINPAANCMYRVKFTELTTPTNKVTNVFQGQLKGGVQNLKCPSSPHCSHNINGRDLDKPCSIKPTSV